MFYERITKQGGIIVRAIARLKWLSFLLVGSILINTSVFACAQEPGNEILAADSDENTPEYKQLNDPDLLQYVEDVIYAGISNEFQSEDYVIENVKAVYYSKEYLEELDYNSKENIWFGYTLSELIDQFQGQKFIFTLGDDQKTIVTEFKDYDDTYDRVIKNVAIGTGVILICVTVSVVSGGLGAAPVSMVFAASAKTGTVMALSSGSLSAVAAGTIKGIETGDINEAVKAGALAGSEQFKWGAIAGAISGGVSELSSIRNTSEGLYGATKYNKGTVEIADDIPQWRQAELRALNQSGGYEQLTYMNGKQVPFGTKGATRPDVVVDMIDHIEAVEVKYYNLESKSCLNMLYDELEREVSARVANLPRGSTQKVILDVTNRGFSEATCNNVADQIWTLLDDIYPNIPIEIVGL